MYVCMYVYIDVCRDKCLVDYMDNFMGKYVQ